MANSKNSKMPTEYVRPSETETKQKEIIVAIKIKESEYARLTRLISGEIILQATAKQSNLKAVVNSLDIRKQVQELRDEMHIGKKCYSNGAWHLTDLKAGALDAYQKVLNLMDGDGS